MKELLESFTKYGVCILVNLAFVFFIVKGISYPDLFTVALTASWGVLGLTEYSRAKGKEGGNLRDDLRRLSEEIAALKESK